MVTGAAPARKVGYEPPLGEVTVARTNLFLNAEVAASGHWAKQRPPLAVDGRLDPAGHWACENLPVWHQVDMGALKSLSSLRVWPYWGDGRVYQYKVEGSADGENWEPLADHSANSITGSAVGDSFSFEPREVRYVRTTFLNSSRGAANGGHLVEIEGYAEKPAAGPRGGIGTVDLRYPPSGALELAAPASGIRLTAWRGERVSAQIVVFADEPQSGLRIDPATLRSPGGEIPVRANFVRYTLADGKPQGDILDTAETLPLEAGGNRPVWLGIDVPATASSGVHTGKVTVRTDAGALDFPVSLEVLDAPLPAPADWQCHVDLWQHPQAVARWHDVRPWSPEHLALMKPEMIRLAGIGQKTITCTLIDEAWGGQTYDNFPGMIRWVKKADGSWSYDYTVFDRWVTFMNDEVGMKNARIHCYTMIPWSLKFRYYDESSGSCRELHLQPGSPEYDAHWGGFLRDFTKHLRDRGWLERTLIGIDERPDALMRGALATLGKHAPMLQVASAIDRPSDLTREMADISPAINHSGLFPHEELERRRKEGRKTTFYVCTNPPVPNTFTFSPPAESEWLGLFASAQGFDGFLRWAYHSWVENPLVSTDFTSWPSGDCFLVYPGNRSSIRFERLRDGIENFEKIRLLREWTGRNPTPARRAALAELDGVLKDFNWQRGSKSGPHADDVRRANAAIEKAARAFVKSSR